MVSILAFVAIFALCGLMLWGSYKIEPHWVSRDGQRMIAYAQPMTSRGEALGRWREVRISDAGNGQVEVRTRRGTLAAPDRSAEASLKKMTRMGTVAKDRPLRSSLWRVSGASPEPPPRKVVYLLDGNDDALMPDLLAVRMPATSKAIPMFEALAMNKASSPSPRRD